MMREPRRRSPESSRRRRRDRRDSREYLSSMQNAGTNSNYNTAPPSMPYTTSPPPMGPAPRGRAGSSSGSSSSSVSSSLMDISRRYPDKKRFGGTFTSFFTAPSERRRRRRRKSSSNKRGVLYFNNSSSSSVNSDMAYGHGYIPRMKSRNFRSRDVGGPAGAHYRDRERERDRERDPNKPATPRRAKTDEEILTLGRQLSDLARAQNDDDLRNAGRSKPSGLVSAAATLSDFRKNKHGSTSRGIGSSRPQYSSSDDASDWESASEDEAESSDEDMAYGSVVSHAIKPTMAAAAGAAAGAAAASAGSRPSDSYGGPGRNKSVVDPRLFGPYNSLRGMVNTPCGFGDDEQSATAARYAQNAKPLRSMTDPTAQAPMRNVYPVPTSDPNRFDVDRSSGPTSRQELPQRSRPGPVPIQQPVPKAPVSSKVYDAEKLEDATRRDSRHSRHRSDEKGWGDVAAAGVAAAAVGAALGSDRKDERKDDRKERRKDSLRDEDKRDRERRSEKSDKSDKYGKYDKYEKRDREEKRDKEERKDRDEKRSKDEKRDRDSKRRDRDADVDKERRKSKRDSNSSKYGDEKDHKRSSRTDDWEDVPKKRRELDGREPDKASYKSRTKDSQVGYDPDSRSEISRSSRRDSRKYDDREYDTARDGRREPPKASKAGDQIASGTASPIPSSTVVDPFQYQVANDAFMTPQNATPARPLTPTVITVDREPNFDDEPLPRSPGSESRLSRKDSFEIEQMVDYRKESRDGARGVDPRKNHEYEEGEHQARSIYDDAKHATAPIGVAAVASAMAVEAERSRDRRRKQFSTDGSRDRSRGPPSDAVQDEADKYYRETAIARKLEEERSRSSTPDRSVINKYDEDEPTDMPTIVTPPEMDHQKDKGPYDAPNADVRIDNKIFPKESGRFRHSSDLVASFKSRDPSCERDRPLLNLVYPTPIPSREPTPALEKQSRSGKGKSKGKDRGVPSSKSDVPDVVIGPKGEVMQPAPSAKSVTWGENETNLYEVDTPEHRSDAELYKGSEAADKPRPRLNKSSAWGVIASAIAGSGSEPVNEPEVVVSESGTVVSSDRGARDESSSEPPVPGPKPASSKTDQMPGGYADDIEFAATLAAGLKDTGFDPNIVVEDPTYRRRDSPPGTDELNGNGWYQKPHSETVTDLGVYETAAAKAAPDSGFVLGEIDTPGDERPAPEGDWSEIPANLSKKERKKREKAAKRQSVEAADPLPAEPSAAPAAPAPEEFTEVPVKLSKKEQRKRDKEAKAQAFMAEPEGLPQTAEPEPMQARDAGAEVWEEPSSKKSKKKNRKSRDLDDGESTRVSVPVDAFDDLQSSREIKPDDEWDTKKSKKKSKRDSSAPVDVIDDVQSPREINPDDEWDTKKSKKKSKRDSTGPIDSFDELQSPKDTIPDDEWDSKKSKKKSKRDSASYDSASYDSRPVEPSEVSVESSGKKSSKSKRRSGTEDDFNEYGDEPPDRGRDPFEDRDVSSVVSDSRYDERRRESRHSKRSSKYDDDDDTKSIASAPGSSRKRSSKHDDDDTKSVASAPGGSRKSKDSEKRSSGSLLSSIFKSNGSKEEGKKESFLDNAGTLGAGVGVAGAAVAAASSLSRSKATEASPDQHEEGPPKQAEQDWDTDVVDPEVVPRAIKPAIDPQYGDLLPLPPSEPGTPTEAPEELPGLPDSRPDTPPEERALRHERLAYTHQRRRSTQETPAKSPSHTAIPIALRMSQRGPSSPGTHKSSPMSSPITPGPDSGGGPKRGSRPTSWDSSRGMKPLLLASHLREGAPEDVSKELELPAPKLGDPPATKQRTLEAAGEAADLGLRIDTDVPAPTETRGGSGSQETTPKAEVKPEFPALPTDATAQNDDLPSSQEPDPVDPMSKDRSSYLLNSTPSSNKSAKSAAEETLAQSPAGSTPSKQRGLDAPLSDIPEDLTSADEHFSDALEGQTDEDTFEDTRDWPTPSSAEDDAPAEPSTPLASSQAAPRPAEDDWDVGEGRALTAKEKKKAKKARKNKGQDLSDAVAPAPGQPPAEAPPAEGLAVSEPATAPEEFFETKKSKKAKKNKKKLLPWEDDVGESPAPADAGLTTAAPADVPDVVVDKDVMDVALPPSKLAEDSTVGPFEDELKREGPVEGALGLSGPSVDAPKEDVAWAPAPKNGKKKKKGKSLVTWDDEPPADEPLPQAGVDVDEPRDPAQEVVDISAGEPSFADTAGAEESKPDTSQAAAEEDPSDMWLTPSSSKKDKKKKKKKALLAEDPWPDETGTDPLANEDEPAASREPPIETLAADDRQGGNTEAERAAEMPFVPDSSTAEAEPDFAPVSKGKKKKKDKRKSLQWEPEPEPEAPPALAQEDDKSFIDTGAAEPSAAKPESEPAAAFDVSEESQFEKQTDSKDKTHAAAEGDERFRTLDTHVSEPLFSEGEPPIEPTQDESFGEDVTRNVAEPETSWEQPSKKKGKKNKKKNQVSFWEPVEEPALEGPVVADPVPVSEERTIEDPQTETPPGTDENVSASQPEAKPEDEWSTQTTGKKSKKDKKRDKSEPVIEPDIPVETPVEVPESSSAQDSEHLEPSPETATDQPAQQQETAADEWPQVTSKKAKKTKKRQSLLASSWEETTPSSLPAEVSQESEPAPSPAAVEPEAKFELPKKGKNKKKKKDVLPWDFDEAEQKPDETREGLAGDGVTASEGSPAANEAATAAKDIALDDTEPTSTPKPLTAGGDMATDATEPTTSLNDQSPSNEPAVPSTEDSEFLFPVKSKKDKKKKKKQAAFEELLQAESAVKTPVDVGTSPAPGPGELTEEPTWDEGGSKESTDATKRDAAEIDAADTSMSLDASAPNQEPETNPDDEFGAGFSVKKPKKSKKKAKDAEMALPQEPETTFLPETEPDTQDASDKKPDEPEHFAEPQIPEEPKKADTAASEPGPREDSGWGFTLSKKDKKKKKGKALDLASFDEPEPPQETKTAAEPALATEAEPNEEAGWDLGLSKKDKKKKKKAAKFADFDLGEEPSSAQGLETKFADADVPEPGNAKDLGASEVSEPGHGEGQVSDEWDVGSVREQDATGEATFDVGPSEQLAESSLGPQAAENVEPPAESQPADDQAEDNSWTAGISKKDKKKKKKAKAFDHEPTEPTKSPRDVPPEPFDSAPATTTEPSVDTIEPDASAQADPQPQDAEAWLTGLSKKEKKKKKKAQTFSLSEPFEDVSPPQETAQANESPSERDLGAEPEPETSGEKPSTEEAQVAGEPDQQDADAFWGVGMSKKDKKKKKKAKLASQSDVLGERVSVSESPALSTPAEPDVAPPASSAQEAGRTHTLESALVPEPVADSWEESLDKSPSADVEPEDVVVAQETPASKDETSKDKDISAEDVASSKPSADDEFSFQVIEKGKKGKKKSQRSQLDDLPWEEPTGESSAQQADDKPPIGGLDSESIDHTEAQPIDDGDWSRQFDQVAVDNSTESLDREEAAEKPKTASAEVLGSDPELAGAADDAAASRDAPAPETQDPEDDSAATWAPVQRKLSKKDKKKKKMALSFDDAAEPSSKNAGEAGATALAADKTEQPAVQDMAKEVSLSSLEPPATNEDWFTPGMSKKERKKAQKLAAAAAAAATGAANLEPAEGPRDKFIEEPQPDAELPQQQEPVSWADEMEEEDDAPAPPIETPREDAKPAEGDFGGFTVSKKKKKGKKGKGEPSIPTSAPDSTLASDSQPSAEVPPLEAAETQPDDFGGEASTSYAPESQRDPYVPEPSQSTAEDDEWALPLKKKGKKGKKSQTGSGTMTPAEQAEPPPSTSAEEARAVDFDVPSDPAAGTGPASEAQQAAPAETETPPEPASFDDEWALPAKKKSKKGKKKGTGSGIMTPLVEDPEPQAGTSATAMDTSKDLDERPEEPSGFDAAEDIVADAPESSKSAQEDDEFAFPVKKKGKKGKKNKGLPLSAFDEPERETPAGETGTSVNADELDPLAIAVTEGAQSIPESMENKSGGGVLATEGHQATTEPAEADPEDTWATPAKKGKTKKKNRKSTQDDFEISSSGRATQEDVSGSTSENPALDTATVQDPSQPQAATDEWLEGFSTSKSKKNKKKAQREAAQTPTPPAEKPGLEPSRDQNESPEAKEPASGNTATADIWDDDDFFAPKEDTKSNSPTKAPTPQPERSTWESTAAGEAAHDRTVEPTGQKEPPPGLSRDNTQMRAASEDPKHEDNVSWAKKNSDHGPPADEAPVAADSGPRSVDDVFRPDQEMDVDLTPAQESSHISHEAPFEAMVPRGKKKKTQALQDTSSPESGPAMKERDLDAGETPRDAEASRKGEQKEEDSAETAGAAGAAAGGVALLAQKFGGGKKKAKGKKKKILDKRQPQEEDIFDDPAVWESADRKTLGVEEGPGANDDFWGGGGEAEEPSKGKETLPTPMSESFTESEGGWKETARQGARLDDDDEFAESPVLGRGETDLARTGPAELLRRDSQVEEPSGRLLEENRQAPVVLDDLGLETTEFRRSPTRSLPAVQEVPEAEGEAERTNWPTPDVNRDSGFVAGSPNPQRRRSLAFEEEPQRDSGVHTGDWREGEAHAARTPEPSAGGNPRRAPFGVTRGSADHEATPERRLRHSPSGTPVLREPPEQPATPEPAKKSTGKKQYGALGSDRGTTTAAAATSVSSTAAATAAASGAAGRHESLKGAAAAGEAVAGQRSKSDSHQPPGAAASQPSPPAGHVARRSASNTSLSRQRTPEPLKFRPESPGINRSTPTPPLRRVNNSKSSDLRALRQQSNTTPVANEGRVRAKDMTDVYDGFGEGRIGSPRSPTRPHSMRRRQSTQVLELESKVEQLLAENRLLTDARTHAEQNLSSRAATALSDRDAEIESLKQSLQFLQNEVSRLTEVNDGLTSANAELASNDNGRYADLEVRHADVSRELEETRGAHASFGQTVQDKDAEIAELRAQLEAAQEQVREMQRQILASKSGDADFLNIRDEDYFDNRCQQLCAHVQQWVLRFSKFSDMRACRLTSEINDEKTIDRLDNSVLDGSDVDTYLNDRVKRRDIFMSMTMNMIWEFVFTRYLFGMDREQRQKLKSLEKLLTEVGPSQAVRQWRAVTLTLLARRDSFIEQRDQDTEAVVQAIFQALCKILPPPGNLEGQIQSQLRRVLAEAVNLSIEMRTQKAEYMMLPPLQPEYDAEGELAATVQFNASMMNNRGSSSGSSNEDLEAQGAVVRAVLFPLVVKKGDDDGAGDEEIVVCPAQVLVARDKGKRHAAPSSDAGGASLGAPSHISLATEHMGQAADYYEGDI